MNSCAYCDSFSVLHDAVFLFLSSVIGISRNQLVSLKKKENGIVQNGKRVTVRAAVHTGDSIYLDMEEEPSQNVLPVDIPIEILYEDDELLVVNKPPYMPTHPSHDHYTDTLANAVVHHYQLNGTSAKFRPITRLDRNTSGIVLIAKTALSASKLSSQMQKGKISKEYIAICEGETPKIFSVNKPIKREDESVITRTVCGYGEGQAASTDFERINTNGEASVLRVRPITGRTHQIRVHLASEGFSIIGDDLYGRPSSLIQRHALHAESLAFEHPSGQQMKITAPLPEDMQRVANLLFD